MFLLVFALFSQGLCSILFLLGFSPAFAVLLTSSSLTLSSLGFCSSVFSSYLTDCTFSISFGGSLSSPLWLSMRLPSAVSLPPSPSTVTPLSG